MILVYSDFRTSPVFGFRVSGFGFRVSGLGCSRILKRSSLQLRNARQRKLFEPKQAPYSFLGYSWASRMNPEFWRPKKASTP